MIDAAILGLGWWGRHIVGCLRQSGKIRITRAVDANPDAAGAVAAQHGLPLATSHDDVLRDPEIDAVILATPHSLHEAQVMAAAGAGKHVFCEKPLALTRAGAARAIAACEQAGVALGVGHMLRWEPAILEVKRLIDDGTLGTIMHVEGTFSHDKLADLAPEDWRASVAEAPAAGMTGMGIHLTDTYTHLLGETAEVYAQTARRVVRSESGDVASVQLRLRSGVTGYLSSILVTPFLLRLQIFGSHAWAELRFTAHPVAPGTRHLTVLHKTGEQQTRTFEMIDTVRANIEAFADAAAGRAPYPIPSAHKLHTVATLAAIVDSVARGKPVAVT